MIPFAAEPIFFVGNFPVTNSVLHTLLVDAILLAGAFALKDKITLVPSKFQNAVESVMEGFYNLISSISPKNVNRIFPYVMAFFLFILIGNWTALLPGVGSIGFYHKVHHETTSDAHETTEPVAHEKTTKETTHEETVHEDTEHADVAHDAQEEVHQETAHEEKPAVTKTETKEPVVHEAAHEEPEKELVPLIRGTASDINTTLALALISIIATHVMSVNVLGFKEYISRFLSFNPLYLFIGLLELVSEVTKIISLSLRLFGNIYAGEVVLHNISGMFAFFAPLPFLGLEIIVGVVQALVFAMLTMTFMSIFTTSHHAETAH